jgi:hypothetical protein
MERAKAKWEFNIAVLSAWAVAVIWIPFPLYEIVKHWPQWNDGFILVGGGIFLCLLSIPMGYESRRERGT